MEAAIYRKVMKLIAHGFEVDCYEIEQIVYVKKECYIVIVTFEEINALDFVMLVDAINNVVIDQWKFDKRMGLV